MRPARQPEPAALAAAPRVECRAHACQHVVTAGNHLNGVLALGEGVQVGERAHEPQAQQAPAHAGDALVEDAKHAEAFLVAADTHGAARVLLLLRCASTSWNGELQAVQAAAQAGTRAWKMLSARCDTWSMLRKPLRDTCGA